MQKGLSTHLFVREPLTVEHLELCLSSGFEKIELFALRPHFDYRNKQRTEPIASWLADHESVLNSIHTPFCLDYQVSGSPTWLSIAALEKLMRQKAVDEIKWAIEFAELVPVPMAVVHMGIPGDTFNQRHLEATYQSLETLLPFSRSLGARIALENIPNTLSRISVLRELLEGPQYKDVGICFDSGHSNLTGNPSDEIRSGEGLILTTHLHDNHGLRDEHLLPFEGNIDWVHVLEALHGIGYGGVYLLELKENGQPFGSLLTQAIGVIDRLQRLEEEMLRIKSREG